MITVWELKEEAEVCPTCEGSGLADFDPDSNVFNGFCDCPAGEKAREEYIEQKRRELSSWMIRRTRRPAR